MLFVFQVDIGRMMTFDMAFTLQSVEDLKIHIEEECDIPVEKQVILINSGEEIKSDARVSSYSAGTDVNPFFLFSKVYLESKKPPTPNVEMIHDYLASDMSTKLNETAKLKPSYDTVVRRTNLAQHFYEIGKELCKTCEQLVYEQKMQNSGWKAVVVNLDNLEQNINQRFHRYQKLFKKYMSSRESAFACLQSFQGDLKLLQRIPALPALFDQDITATILSDNSIMASTTEPAEKTSSLLDWISKNDNFLEHLYDRCSNGLTQIEEDGFVKMCKNVEEILGSVNTPELRAVGGLRDRFSSLESMKNQVCSALDEQQKLAHSFMKNQQAATQYTKEPSIFPDLCATHMQQLEILLKNHNDMRDIMKTIVKAKTEFCENLHRRLQWVVFMQNQLQDVDTALSSHFTKLVHLQDHLNALQQVHTASTMYLSAVTEVVRRRQFSQSFLLWASELACHSLTIYNEELIRRKDFQSQFDAHFLSALFRGMDDIPPNFATEAPSIFDSALPNLSEDDLETLKKELPDLASHLILPQPSPIINCFLLRSIKEEFEDKAVVKCEHRTEIENIRARFKLLTMERSPSESSLEKIETSETFLLQMHDNFDLEKEAAVSDAVSKESDKWQRFVDEKLQKLYNRFELEKQVLVQDITTKVSMEKDTHIAVLMEELKRLSQECDHYRESFQHLYESTEPHVSNEENKSSKLNELDSQASVSQSVCEGKIDASTSPVKISKKRDLRYSKVSIDGCKNGDLVFIVWNNRYKNFTIYQESHSIYFLHSDCLQKLGLHIINEQPNKLHTIGRVIDKEYCHARKETNRFNIPKGTKFFRVRVKTVQKLHWEHGTSMSQSQTMCLSESITSSHQIPAAITTSLPASPDSNLESFGWNPQEPCIFTDNTLIPESSDNQVETGKEVTENLNLLLPQSNEDSSKLSSDR